MSCISRGEAEGYISHYAPVLSGVTVLCIDQEMMYDYDSLIHKFE